MPPSPSPIDSPTLNPFFSSAGAPNGGYNRRGSGSGKPNIAPIAYDLSTGRWAVRVPLFYMAGFAVKCLDWFVLAVMRDRVRGASARDRGKRAF